METNVKEFVQGGLKVTVAMRAPGAYSWSVEGNAPCKFGMISGSKLSFDAYAEAVLGVKPWLGY